MVLNGNEQAMDGASALTEGRSNFIEILEVRRAHVAGEVRKAQRPRASIMLRALYLPPFPHDRKTYLILEEIRVDMAPRDSVGLTSRPHGSDVFEHRDPFSGMRGPI